MRISSIKIILSKMHKMLEDCLDVSCVPEGIRDIVVIDEFGPTKDVVWKIIEYLKEETSNLPGEIVYTQKDLNVVKSNLSLVDSEIAHYTDKVNEVSAQIDELSVHIARLREEIKQDESQYNAYEEQRLNRLKELESLIQKKSKELASLSSSEAVDPEYYASLESELEALKAEYTTVKSTPNPYKDKDSKAAQLADLINKQKELVGILESYRERLKNLQKQSNTYRRELETIMSYEGESKVSVDELRAGMLDSIANVGDLLQIKDIGPFSSKIAQHVRVALGISNYFSSLVGIEWPWVLRYPDVSTFLRYVEMVGLPLYIFR